MPVRTARLAHGLSTAANVTENVYTCPAGRTAIVKEISVQASGPGDRDWGFFVLSGPLSVTVANGHFTGGGQAAHSGHFLVLEPGDKLQSYCSIPAGLAFHVSGSELEGVAPAGAVQLPD